jgi:hypothetical protein
MVEKIILAIAITVSLYLTTDMKPPQRMLGIGREVQAEITETLVNI